MRGGGSDGLVAANLQAATWQFCLIASLSTTSLVHISPDVADSNAVLRTTWRDGGHVIGAKLLHDKVADFSDEHGTRYATALRKHLSHVRRTHSRRA